jgi:hypothetical protein
MHKITKLKNNNSKFKNISKLKKKNQNFQKNSKFSKNTCIIKGMVEIYDIMNITCQNLYHLPYQPSTYIRGVI